MTTQRKTTSIASPNWPRHALSRACLLALAGFGSVAFAQPLAQPGAALSVINASLTQVETAGAVWSAYYNLIAKSSQYSTNMGDASGSGIRFGESLTNVGTVPTSVSNNIAQSLAMGNQSSSTGGLSLLVNTGTADGLLVTNLQSLSALTLLPAESGGSASIGTLSVSAVVKDASAFIDQTGMGSADLTLSGNALKASAQLNVSDIRVEGATPSGYVSTATASSSVTFGSTGAAIGNPANSTAGSTGSVNLSNLQSTFSASPTATLDGSGVELSVVETTAQGTGPATFTSAAVLSGNTLSAATANNTGTSIFRATEGSSAWNASVSVTNLQNTAAGPSDTTDSLASVSDSRISADLRNAEEGQTNLTGSLTLSDNQISASSLGNAAGSRSASGAISAGNAILFEGGASIAGSRSGTGTSVALESGTARSVADLTLVNAQSNTASSFLTSVDGAGVSSNLDNLAGGTLTQSGNTVSASSTANLAGNLVSAGQGVESVATFNASVAALNVQSNKSLDSTATVKDSAVSAVVGIAAAVPTGTVTLSNNTLAATAEGNVGVTTVALKADNLTVSGTLGASPTQGVTLNAAAGTASSSLGVVALSVQSNEGVGSLTANNEGTGVSLSFNDQTVDAVGIADMSATLSGNRLQSTATANSASNSATLEGTNGTGLSAAVGNSQRNDEMAISASAGSLTPLAVNLTAGAMDSSVLTLTNNTLSAAATGNTAFSRLDVSLANASGAAALALEPEASVAGNAVTSQADLALANSQINSDTDLTAAMVGGVAIDVGNVSSVASPSTIALSNNQIGATVEVNRASSAMALKVGNLSSMTAALGSRQGISDSAATATTGGAVTLDAGSVEGAALTASGNTVNALTLGNAVTNALTLTGTTATGAGTSLALSTDSAAASATGASTSADVSLANAQSSTGNTLSALTGDLTAAAAVTLNLGSVSGASTLNLANNTIGATTSVNSASNALSLGITNVTGMTAGVASAQTLSDSPANAITNGVISLEALSLTGSSATMSGNAVAASVFGNSADNTLSLKATTASGRDVAPSVSAGVSSTAAGDFVVANNQAVSGIVTPGIDGDPDSVKAAVLSALTDGTIKVSAGELGALTSSALTLIGNSITAYTGANSATNQVALNVTDLSAASAGVASRQVIDSAEVTSVSTGSVLVEGGAVTGSALTLSGNTLKSTSLGNVVNNGVTLVGTNATGSGAVAASDASATAGSAAAAVADMAVVNLQDSRGITLSATTVGASGIAVGAVGPALDGQSVLANAALTLSNNATSALAQSNSASNTLVLASTNLNGMSAGVVSSQATDGTVSALAASSDFMDGNVVGTPVVLSNNAFSAVAGMNEAFNTLTAAGASLLGGGGTPESSVGIASTAGVDFSVVNAQSGLGSVSAVADPGIIGFSGSLTGGSLSITGNTVLARASVNTASNQLTLAATNRLEATTAVNNVQDMDSVVSAIVVDSANAPSLLGAALTSGGSSTVAVSNNSVTAQATGNLAANALNATAVSGVGSSGSSAQPTFAVLNQQRTQGSIDAILNGTTLGAALNGIGGSTSVQGNQMVALAYGNSVDNAISMSALPGSLNTASAAITNVQYNMASISASVSGASMLASGTVSGSGSVNVSGNTITAQVVGNRSVNSITAR